MIENASELSSRLYAWIMKARREDALALLRVEAERSGFNAVIAEILEPTLTLIGERWHLDSISLAQGYVGGKIAEDMLHLLAEDEQRRGLAPDAFKGRAIVCNAEDDYHSLGRKMVASFLGIAGWEVVDLGNDVLATDLIDEAERRNISVVGVSAMMLTNARNISKVRREIDRRGLGASIKLAVGGAVFVMRPELVVEVGGDGTALTAMEAPAIFEGLAKAVESGSAQ